MVEREFDALLGQREGHVNAGRLDVRIDHRHPFSRERDQRGQVGRQVRLARAAAKGMDRNDFCHGVPVLF
jgi:hypothetical protein